MKLNFISKMNSLRTRNYHQCIVHVYNVRELDAESFQNFLGDLNNMSDGFYFYKNTVILF